MVSQKTHKMTWPVLTALLPMSGLLLAVSAPAQATAILTVSDGTNTRTVTDNGTGVVSFDSLFDPTWQSTSPWKITIDTGITQPFQGDAQHPDMHLNVLASGIGDLKVTFLDDGFSGIGPLAFMTNVYGILGAPGSMSVTTQSTLGSLSSVGTSSPGGLAGTDSAIQTLNGSYGLEFLVDIDHTALGTSSFDATLVPEPAAATLLLSVLFSGGLFLLRRRTTALAPV